MTKQFLITIGILGGTGVIMGAFGSHLLKPNISTLKLDIWETAVFYQMIHTLALLAVTFMSRYLKRSYVKSIYYFFVIGIVLFSGSLYINSVSELAKISIGPINYLTPLGGLSLITGWIIIMFSGITYQHQKRSSKH
jgi:uncharacterized membrane protein YgdD (TMEM256/DUF423 family)